MKKFPKLTLVLLFGISLSACTRPENENTAGKGGDATLRIVPKHHNENKNIINGKIYIKYNAQDAPSTFSADYSLFQSDSSLIILWVYGLVRK